MSFTASISEGIASGSRSLVAVNDFSGGAVKRIDESIPDASTDKLVNLAIDVSQLQAIYIKSDQDITIETNDGAAPDNTLNLLANIPYVWYTSSYFTNLLTVDITALYVTNNSGSAAALQIEAIEDPTP